MHYYAVCAEEGVVDLAVVFYLFGRVLRAAELF